MIWLLRQQFWRGNIMSSFINKTDLLSFQIWLKPAHRVQLPANTSLRKTARHVAQTTGYWKLGQKWLLWTVDLQSADEYNELWRMYDLFWTHLLWLMARIWQVSSFPVERKVSLPCLFQHSCWDRFHSYWPMSSEITYICSIMNSLATLDQCCA